MKNWFDIEFEAQRAELAELEHADPSIPPEVETDDICTCDMFYDTPCPIHNNEEDSITEEVSF